MNAVDRPGRDGIGAGTELLLVLALSWLALVSIPLGLGGIGLSWDALNHHMYLGWVADHPRFDRDFLAASYQSYQYPYLYWPAFKLMEAGASGVVAGVVQVSLHALVVPALWTVARVCVTERNWYGTAMRAAAVLLGLSGQLFLSLMDITANDALAAIPLVWGVALALLAISDVAPRWMPSARAVALSGLLAGVSVAFKLSNGPLALLMPMLWIFAASEWRGRAVQMVRGCMWTLAGFALAYGYWGWKLWEQFGNPLYPFYDGRFAALRAAVGWQP